MTLQELERLIRRIEEAMERPPGDGALPRLAGDYAGACHSAAQRLRQCAAMIGAGDEYQALQLAETTPALLDQLTLLSFRRSPNFRALCLAQNFAPAENFEIKAIRQLNELYAKGIDKDHALYREYRRAIMVNDDARALAVLRSITRLNHSDANAAAELARLEHKFHTDKIHRLERLVRDKASANEIATVAEELEPVPEAKRSAAWIPAQTIRAAWLVEKAREAQRAAESDELQRILSKIHALQHSLIENDRKSVEELERWSAADTARRKEAADRRAAVLQLTEIVTRLEQEQIGTGKKSLTELRRSVDALENGWRHVEEFRAEIAGDVATRAQKLREGLRLEMERSVRASRRLGFSIVAVAVALCIGAAWVGYSTHASNALARRIVQAVRERKIAETESALAESTNEFFSQKLNGRENAFAAEALARERNLKEVAEQARAAIETDVRSHFTNASVIKIAGDFEAARKADAALAPEFRLEADPALAEAESAWHEFLERERNGASARLIDALAPIGSVANRDLQYSADPSQVASAAASIQKQLAAARALMEPPLIELRPRQEAVFRYETLEARARKFASDATNWFIAQRDLNQATNLAGYTFALQLLATNGFTPAAQRPAIAAVAGSYLSDHAILGPLLLPNGPATALAEPPRTSRVPDEVLPAEREIQRRLRDDENIQNVSRLEIEVKALPPENPRRRRVVYLRGELQRRITRRAGQIYDPVENPSALQFESKEMSSLDYVVEEPTPTPERELYDRIGLTRLIDSNTGKYQVSLLQSLDDINLDRRASPLFRAWLYLQICKIVDAQPVQWGAIWSPALAADRAELERAGGGSVQSGDWFVPAANSRYAAALYAHFDRAALHSYARQSAFFKRLLPKAAETGLRVIGYVNADGEPIMNDTRAFGAVYAIVAPNQSAQIIFSKITPNRRLRALVRAMPFSPLLVFGGDAADLINSTLQSLSSSAAAVNLPESLPPILRPAL
jgi:hypothetical protein